VGPSNLRCTHAHTHPTQEACPAPGGAAAAAAAAAAPVAAAPAAAAAAAAAASEAEVLRARFGSCRHCSTDDAGESSGTRGDPPQTSASGDAALQPVGDIDLLSTAMPR
jgi:hypothetical protein